MSLFSLFYVTEGSLEGKLLATFADEAAEWEVRERVRRKEIREEERRSKCAKLYFSNVLALRRVGKVGLLKPVEPSGQI